MGTIPSIFTENLRLATPATLDVTNAGGTVFEKAGATPENQSINERIDCRQSSNKITDKDKSCNVMNAITQYSDITKALDTIPQVKTTFDNKDKDDELKQTFNKRVYDKNMFKHIVPEIRVETEQDRKQVISIRNTDPDPRTQLNADTTGFGSTSLNVTGAKMQKESSRFTIFVLLIKPRFLYA